MLLLILAAVATYTAIVLTIIHFDEIVAWFRSLQNIMMADKDHIAFTINEKMESGDYKVVQGIFNQRTSTVTKGRVMKSEEIDQQFAAQHASDELVIYT